MKEMPASKAYRLLEVGPVVLVTTARRVVPPMKSLRTFAPNARLRKVQGLGKSKVERQSELVLILVESVMHLPEMPVGAREFRGFRRAFRLRVELRQRKIAKHETKLLPEMLLHRLTMGKAAPQVGH
jgi:hypothetical protein